MSSYTVIVVGLFILSVISGMLGLGVAFAAVPFLSLFLPDLVHQVQPLTLILNGLTGLFSAIGFARSGYVDWPKAIALGVIAAIAAPLGSYLVQFISQIYIWPIYLAAVIYLTYNLFKPVKSSADQPENFKLALILVIPIAILAGFLGVGPGFLLMPTLILLHFEPKRAAGINAFAITAPSFTALIPHWSTMQIDWGLTGLLLLVGAIGSFGGARVTSLYVPGNRLKQMFGVLIVIMTLYKIYTLLV